MRVPAVKTLVEQSIPAIILGAQKLVRVKRAKCEVMNEEKEVTKAIRDGVDAMEEN